MMLRLRPRPRWGAHSAFPDPVAEFRGRKGVGNDLGRGRELERKGNWKGRGAAKGVGRERGNGRVKGEEMEGWSLTF